MEDVRKILQQSDVDLNSSDTDSDVSFAADKRSVLKTTSGMGYHANGWNQQRTEGESKKKKRNGEERLPTRRPDPNVYNRNALLARENRRKKKAYLETIEKELEEARNTNRSLLKALKKQFKVVSRLEKEKQYFKSILANHTEIRSLVSALNVRKSPLRASSISPESSVGSTYRSSRSSSYDPEPLSITFENSENGSVATTPYPNVSPASSYNFFDTFFTDYEPTTAFDNTWNELLEENCFGLCEETQTLTTTVENTRAISDEHSYVKETKDTVNTTNTIVTNEVGKESGICLHISGGKLSLEFCPSCHWNASRTPPSQLLQDNYTDGTSV